VRGAAPSNVCEPGPPSGRSVFTSCACLSHRRNNHCRHTGGDSARNISSLLISIISITRPVPELPERRISFLQRLFLSVCARDQYVMSYCMATGISCPPSGLGSEEAPLPGALPNTYPLAGVQVCFNARFALDCHNWAQFPRPSSRELAAAH
jgi:hypothetical protein